MLYEVGAKYKIADAQEFENRIIDVTPKEGVSLEGFEFTVSGIRNFFGQDLVTSRDFVFNGYLENPCFDMLHGDNLLAQGTIVKVEEV